MQGEPPAERMLDRRDAVRQVSGSLLTAAGLALVAHLPAGAQEATPVVPADFKVVFHVSQGDHWSYAVSNLKNLTAEWPHASLRVVADGTSVLAIQGESDLTRELSDLMAKGVALAVCPNALKEHGIAPEAIVPGASTALGGVVALVQAYGEGFLYIKP